MLNELKENFDTDLFYNDVYDNYNGSLEISIDAEKKMVVVKYTYYTMNTEDSRIEKSFKELSEVTNPWRSGEREVKKLTNEEFLNRMKITRKRLRSKYYPEKREGQEKQDLVEFYNKLQLFSKKV